MTLTQEPDQRREVVPATRRATRRAARPEARTAARPAARPGGRTVARPATRPAGRPAGRQGDRREREQPGPGFWLLAVVLIFACLCLLVSHLNRFYAYDEAIYLSQVYPGQALPFTAPRARGLSWLVAPLGWIDAPLPVVRTYLLTLNCGLMYLGFGTWLPLLGRRAVLAAAAFALSWAAIFEATEVFPNFPSAMCAVAAAGCLARSASPSARVRAGSLAGVTAAVAPMAVIRPMEAACVAAGLGVAALLLPGSTRTRTGARPASGPARAIRRRVGALAAGLLIGWLPWLAEAQVRFGGPVQRLRDASENVSGGLHPQNLLRQLALTDGPISGASTGALPSAPLAGILWWAALTAGLLLTTGLAGYALLTRLARKSGPAGRGAAGAGQVPGAVFGAAAGLAGAASAAQYLLLAGVIEARFLLPAYALLTLALCSLLPAGRAPGTLPVGAWLTRTAGTAVLAAVLVAFGVWQVRTVAQLSRVQEQGRRIAGTLADVLMTESGGTPCYFASQEAFPVISVASGCRGARLDPASPQVFLHDDPGRAPVYGLIGSDPRLGPIQPVPGTARRLRADGAGSWWLFVIPRSAVVVSSG